MSSPDEPVDMEISDGEEPMSDMEVSDSDIDPPVQVTYNLADLPAQSRVMTDPSSFYTYQVDGYYQQTQYGYHPEQAYPAPPTRRPTITDDDDTDSLASFFTAPLAAEHEDEPGLIRDEEEADMETLAYYKQKVAEYEEKMEQTEKEKRKLQQELLRLQVVFSMEKNKKTKRLQADTPPPSQTKDTSAAQSSPSNAVNGTSAVIAAPLANAVPSASTATSTAPVSTTPWIIPENSAHQVSAISTPVRPPASAPTTHTSSSSSAGARSSVRSATSTQQGAFSSGPAIDPPVTSSSAAKLTLSSLAQPGTPAPSKPIPMNTRTPRTVTVTPPQQRHATPVASLSRSMLPKETKPVTPPMHPVSQQHAISPTSASHYIPSPKSFQPPPQKQSNKQAMQHQKPVNASPKEMKKSNPPAVVNALAKPGSKGSAFKPYESPLKRYGLANTNTSGLRAGNPEQQMCKYETVGGTCNDDTCQALHFRDFQKNI